jgi:hypothetical protein
MNNQPTKGGVSPYHQLQTLGEDTLYNPLTPSSLRVRERHSQGPENWAFVCIRVFIVSKG